MMNIKIALESYLTSHRERFRFARNTLVPLLCICMVLSCAYVVQADTPPPTVVAQGFDIAKAREGIVGHFSKIRIRVEAPEGIGELRIKERSYEADLATTLERSHLRLFGLEKRAKRYQDLTLNFQNYLNNKIESAGEYTVEITVVDNEGHKTKALLHVVARNSMPEDSVDIETFRLERIGAGPVQGSPDFGITWETIESSRVVIEISSKEDGAVKLGELTQSDYTEVKTKSMLKQRVLNAETTETIELTTANNGASGRIIAIVHQNREYLLRVSESKIEYLDFGTNVTLIGEYKY